MKKGRTEMILAGVILAIMLGWTGHTALRIPMQSRLWQQRQAELRELSNMQETLEAWDAKVTALDPWMDSPFVDIRTFLRNQFPGLRTDIQLESSEPAWPGWQVDRYRIRMDSVPTDGIGALLTLLETQRPPWRITALQLDASDREFDQARLIIGIEGLQPEN